jgi:exodeoxyribonuclease VIII
MKRDYLSYTALKAFAKSPAHYIQYVMGDRVETPDMKFGTAFHKYVLERNDFDSSYDVMPKVDKRTKAGKAEWSKRQNGSRVVIDESELARIMAMQNKIEEHPEAIKIYEEGLSEIPVVKKIHGIEFKGWIDRTNEHGTWDLKTCQDASPNGFKKAAYNMDYYLQAAIYCELTGRDQFRWLAIEKTAPYNVMVYDISPDALYWSKARLKTLVSKFKLWDGSPESYSNEVVNLELPSWV